MSETATTPPSATGASAMDQVTPADPNSTDPPVAAFCGAPERPEVFPRDRLP